MDAYVTGGRGGGGTVFALEVDEPGRMVWAGVRRGDVKGFDWRSGRRNGASGGAQEVSPSAPWGLPPGLASCGSWLADSRVSSVPGQLSALDADHAPALDPRSATPTARSLNGRVSRTSSYPAVNVVPDDPPPCRALYQRARLV